MSAPRRGRPPIDPAGRKGGSAFYVSPSTGRRLAAFCDKNPAVRITRASIVDMAINRLLDQFKDDPANLFSK